MRVLALLILLSTTASAAPLVIAHRGAPAHRPEHTLAGYRLAIEQGADYIEPDLVVTKDGVLVARHDVLLATAVVGPFGVERNSDGRPLLIEATTDVAERPEFADRLAIRDLDGERVAGWFAEDFTFSELRTLRARERLPKVRPGNRRFANERIPSFEEVLALAREGGVGVYPELKHPTYLASRGHDVVALLLEHPLPDRTFVQCFEIAPLLELHGLRPELKLVQLIGALDGEHSSFSYPYDVRAGGSGYGIPLGAESTYADLVTPDALAWIATYAVGVGPWIASMDIQQGGAAWLKGVDAAGLQLHPYTVRPEAKYRVAKADGTALSIEEELKLLVDLGADGVFVEDVPAAVRALK